MTRKLFVVTLGLGLLAGCASARPWSTDTLESTAAREWQHELDGRIRDLSGADEVHILLIGDSGKRRGLARTRVGMESSCAETGCDLALMLGDNFYLLGPRSPEDERFRTHFAEPLEFLGPDLDVWAVPGNHGYLRVPGFYRASPRAQIGFTYRQQAGDGPDWLMPSYLFQIPKLPPWLNIVGFDTELTVEEKQFDGAPVERQAAVAGYLDEIDAALKRKPGWRVLFGHHPLLTTGDHVTDASLETLRGHFTARRSFQVYFAGHDHDQQLIEADGFVQVVQGAASKTRAAKWGRRERKKAYDEELSPLSQWVGEAPRVAFCAELGYGIATFREHELVLVFYGEGGKELGRWHWTRQGDEIVAEEGLAGDASFHDLCPSAR